MVVLSRSLGSGSGDVGEDVEVALAGMLTQVELNVREPLRCLCRCREGTRSPSAAEQVEHLGTGPLDSVPERECDVTGVSTGGVVVDAPAGVIEDRPRCNRLTEPTYGPYHKDCVSTLRRRVRSP